MFDIIPLEVYFQAIQDLKSHGNVCILLKIAPFMNEKSFSKK